MKKSKSWEEKKEEKYQDILRKKYMRATNTNMRPKQIRDYDHIADLDS